MLLAHTAQQQRWRARPLSLPPSPPIPPVADRVGVGERRTDAARACVVEGGARKRGGMPL